MESFSPEIQNLVIEIAHKNGMTNYTVDVNKSVSKEGDGYIGILNGLSLIDKDSDNKLNLVVKRAPTNENWRKQLPTRACFLREILMYDEVLPELLKFQEEYNIPNPFQSVTKFYGYINEEYKETLILRNLKDDGYQLCNRQEPLDAHHLKFVITEYAKLHALSHAMKKLQPKRFEKLIKLVGNNVMNDFNKVKPKKDGESENSSDSPGGPNPMDYFFFPTLEALRNKPKELEVVKRLKEDCFKLMILMSGKGEENGVISHGDCWSANLLFKYEDEDKPQIPTKLCLIDWQMSVVGTPIHDLSYFLFLSAEKKDLNQYTKYLRLYHTVLSETLTTFGLDPDKVYSLELLEKEWREKSKIGFFMALIMMQQTLSEGKMYEFEESATEGKSVFANNRRKNEITDLFKQRMGDLVEFLVDNDLIS